MSSAPEDGDGKRDCATKKAGVRAPAKTRA